jgi:hypothetical protein
MTRKAIPVTKKLAPKRASSQRVSETVTHRWALAIQRLSEMRLRPECRFAASWGHLKAFFAGSWGHPERAT